MAGFAVSMAIEIVQIKHFRRRVECPDPHATLLEASLNDRVVMHLALVYETFMIIVNKLDRVLDRVLCASSRSLVDVIDHRAQRGRFA